MEEEIEEVDLERGSTWKIEVFGPEQDQKEKDLKGANDRLMSRLHKKLKALPEKGEQRCTIFRVPENIRKSKPHLFEPSVVSIGPYHRGKKHLRAIEEMKWPLLRDFINLVNDASLETYITEMRALEAQARECYDETIDMDSDAFVEMMLLDGSFIIQFFMNEAEGTNMIYNAGWKNSIVSYDLVMIENQIPFFILEKMSSCLNGDCFSSDSLQFTVGTLVPQGLLASPTIATTPPKNIYHLLHLCHHYLVPTDTFDLDTPISPDKTQKHSQLCPSWIPPPTKLIKTCLNLQNNHESRPSSRSLWSLPCVTELQEAGVTIKKKKPPCHFSDVTFQSGVLEIPALHIGNDAPVMMMNLVALEQALLDVPQLFTTYHLFMDAIVNTANDVTILQRLDIIDNMLSSEEEVALYFNQSGQYIELESNHYLAELFTNVKQGKADARLFQQPLVHALPRRSNLSYSSHMYANHVCHIRLPPPSSLILHVLTHSHY